MVSFKDVHHICIGFDQHADVMFNRAIIRNDFDNSDDLWLTLVYNGDLDRVPSGAGENTFIKIEDNRGYGYGALDAINKGLDFASAGYRDIVILTNFDGYFFSEEKYKVLLNEFIESGKPFCAGLHTQYKVPLTDLMLFKRDFLKELLPIKDEVAATRKEMEQKFAEGLVKIPYDSYNRGLQKYNEENKQNNPTTGMSLDEKLQFYSQNKA